jgi:hypothetical protein
MPHSCHHTNRPNRLRALFTFFALCATLLTSPVWAQTWELSGRKTVSAVTRDQQLIPLGTVLFTPQAGGRSSFVLSMEYSPFVDHFLSMKEFKCLQGPDEVLCHVPYPYKNPATVSSTPHTAAQATPNAPSGDYAWLEHQLLFLFKQPRDFGAKLWNGLYFHFEPDAQGLVGRPQAVDLNLISGPPDDLQTPPYSPQLRDAVASGSHWIDHLLIR